MNTKNSDPTKCNYEQFKESIEEAGLKYSDRQIKQVLSEFGYNEFPDNGINGEGFDKLMNRIAEIDDSEAKLMQVKRKDLSSKVLEAPVKIKKEKNTPRTRTKHFKRNLKNFSTKLIITASIIAAVCGAFTWAAKHDRKNAEYFRLEKEMYRISDVNGDYLLDYNEYLKLGHRFEEITGESYISISNTPEELIQGLKYNIFNNPNRNEILKEFIETYGDSE